MAVGLSEITSIRGDAEIGAGTAGTAANLANLPADALSIGVLQTASAARAVANKYAQEQYQKNLNDYLRDQFNTLDVNGIMEKDYDVVIPEYAQLAKNIADNLDVIMNPSVNFERYRDLRNQEAQLRGKIAQSKQQLALRTGAMNFIGTHPGFQTPDNLAAVEKFTEQPLENRDLGSLINLMPRYDLMQDTISKAANTAAMKKTKNQDIASPFMNTTTMVQYYKDAYDEAVRAMLGGNDAFNRPMSAVVGRAFESAPDYVKRQYTVEGTGEPDLNRFAIEQLYGPLRNQDDIAIERDINPIYKNKMDLQNDLARIAAQGREARRNLKFGKSLEDKELKTLATEIPVRQLSIFSAGSQPAAAAETIQLQGKGPRPANWDIPGDFGSIGAPGGELRGFPLNLDAWLVNAYSIPTGKEKVIDPITRQVISEDSYLRPERAWVTGEQNPNARKVIIRYQDKNGPRDLVVPYAENLQLLNNVAGQTNAVKLGGAKADLLRTLTGKVTPSYEELQAVPLFSNPNIGGPGVQASPEQRLPIIPGTAPASTTNPAAGGSLNYAEWKKQQGR
jgi:hypothetical protein